MTDVDALDQYWSVCPNLKKSHFTEMRPGYLSLAVDKSAIKTAIYEHPEFVGFRAKMEALFSEWRDKTAATLKALEPGCHPKTVIAELGEGLLAHYAGKPLIGDYDVYQHLMDYWAGTMQDDCYLIAADGWKAEPSRIVESNKAGKQVDKGWSCDLVPKPLIVARYFAQEQATIAELEADQESLSAQMAALEEEQGGEDGLFAELDKVNKSNVTARLKEIKGDLDAVDEERELNSWLKLCVAEASRKKGGKRPRNPPRFKRAGQVPNTHRGRS